jgi:nucleoside-diphosphate-sugar epimerase
MSRERILVVGATSFVGRRIVRSLEESDWAAPVVDEFGPDPAKLRQVLNEVGGVVNATMGAPRLISAAAAALFAALDSHKSRMPVVHLSSMTVYGPGAGEFAETQRSAPSLDPYPAAHAAAEAMASRCPDAVILRPGCEYGPECLQWSWRVAEWLRLRRIGDLGPMGDGLCNLIYIDDLVVAVLTSLRSASAAGLVFNVAMSSPPTWNEYLTSFGVALGAVPVRRVTRRRWALETRLLAPPLKIAELAAERLGLKRVRIPPAVPPSFRQLCSQEIRLNVDRAERTLGMTWTPLPLGLAATAQWCLSAGR